MGWNRSEKVFGLIKGHPILFILRIRFIISGTKRKVFVLYNFASMNKKVLSFSGAINPNETLKQIKSKFQQQT